MGSNKDKGRLDDRVVNVDPNADSGADNDFSPPSRSRNTGGGRNFRSSGGAGLQNAWANYRRALSDAFNKMNRFEQEALITRLCQIVTIGVALLALLLFYHMMPLAVRVLIVPVGVVGAWWAANNVVTPVIITRMESLMKRKTKSDNE
jgi:hypothetical protein